MAQRPSPLADLTSAPGSSALFTDIDGTLAAIVPRPEDAKVPGRAAEALRALGGRLAIVACVTGRPAAQARAMVGVEEIAYAGNHGIEVLMPGQADPRVLIPEAERHMATELLAELRRPEWGEAGLRIEDKGPIKALHWRGARDEGEAEELAESVGGIARSRGLSIHRGRKVLELRPPVMPGKDGAVAALLDGSGASRAVFCGDDLTDVDAFRRIHRMREEGELEVATTIAIASEEAPEGLTAEADTVIGGPDEWIAMLEEAAG